jgi:uncharacterized protein YggT (Ycf19 family)
MAEQDDGKTTGLRFARVLVWLVYAFFVVALIILVLTFFLQLFNASPTAEFTQWVYRSADRVLEPFRGIFPEQNLGENGSVIDFAVVFAIIMYGILAMLLHALIDWIDDRISRSRADEQRRLADAQYQATYAAPMGAAQQQVPQQQVPQQQVAEGGSQAAVPGGTPQVPPTGSDPGTGTT